mgnify:CR=1 FL=1
MLSGETSIYKYKFVDDAVFDGIKYTYSIVAYDIGVMPTVTAYVDTFDVDGNKIGSVPALLGGQETLKLTRQRDQKVRTKMQFPCHSEALQAPL